MQRIITTLLLTMATMPFFAFKTESIKILGVVSDEKGKPVQFATVTLLNNKDSSLVKGDVTNDKGAYQFEDISNGNYIISTSNVGYSKYYSDIIKIDETSTAIQKNIQLTLSDKTIKEVKVLGKKPMIEVKADKTVFNVEQSINSAGSNALDLLRKSPGVRVDKDDNIEMRGKNNVMIYIDGKPSYLDNKDLAAYLKNMQSSDIELIELITNPSAKYDAEGNAGIINIKLKKNKKFGTNGTINLGAAQGRYFKHNEGVNLNYRNKKINVFGSYSFNGGRGYNNQVLDRQQSGMRYDFEANNVNANKTNSARAGLDYYLNSKSVIGVMVNANYSKDKFTSNSKTYIGPIGYDANQVLVASNAIPNSKLNSGINLNYKYEDTIGRSFNVDVDYGNFQSESKSYQPNIYKSLDETIVYSQAIFRNKTPIDINIYSFKTDYEQNLLKGKLGIGAKVAYVKTNNDFRFYDVINDIDILNLKRTNNFVYTENVNAAYINYSRNFSSRLSTQYGLRMEHTHSEGMLNSATPQNDDTVKRDYINLFPSAGLSYTINEKHTIGLTFSRRIDRPNYQDLNPFENKLDELTYEKGNAFLRPQYTNSIELNHTFMQFMTTSIGYSKTVDMYMQTTDTVEQSRTYVTQKNFASQEMGSLNISFPMPVKKWWMVFANISANYINLQANFEGRKLQNKYFTYVFYADNTFTLPKDYSLNISGWLSGPSYWGGTFRTNSLGTLDIGAQKSLLKKKLIVKLSISDLFRSQRWFATSNFSGLYIKGNGYGESRQIRLNFTYRFGSNQIAKQRERKSGASSEKDRIKN